MGDDATVTPDSANSGDYILSVELLLDFSSTWPNHAQ